MTVRVYCKHFISTAFPIGLNKFVTIHGTNRHSLEVPADTPYLNLVEDADWAEVEAQFIKTNTCPHLFGDKNHQPLIYVAKDDVEGKAIGDEIGDVVPEKYVMTADENLQEEPEIKQKRIRGSKIK